MFKTSEGYFNAKTGGKLMTALVFLLSFLLAISIFKNISYPLFWADEGMTVMGGVRVLQFGYPKVHDGKNVFYDLQYPGDKSLGIDRKTDAYVGGAGWGQYYIAALGVRLAAMSDDFFVRTGIIRTVFAALGLAGLFGAALLGTRFFYSGYSKTRFLALFILIEILSVPLTLHLRDARYYAVTVFLSSFIIFVYARFRILKETRYPGYLVIMPVSLFFLYITFSPAYFVFMAAISLFESGSLVIHLLLRSAGDGPFRHYARNMLPCLLTLIPVYPLMLFFDVFNISEKLSEYYALGFKTDAAGMYLDNLSFIWGFFMSSDLVLAAIFLKALLLTAVLTGYVSDKKAYVLDMPRVVFSAFLSTVFIVYFFAIPRIPNPLFTRYFIPLQPVLTLIIIMDAAVLFNITSQLRSGVAVYYRKALVIILIAFAAFHISNNLPFLRGHIYELTHPYQGPLDHAIPYIRAKYGKTDGLVIATNYEETSFMYYLDARTTIGFTGNNLQRDANVRPDVIMYRKDWENFKTVFSGLIQGSPYEEISFPVVDYAVNNIPELHRDFPHHWFRTQASSDEWMKTYIFVKK